MGDKNTIPRTFAGQLGVADSTNAMKRRYISFMLGTTGRYLGNATTGGFVFQRNQVFEKMTVNYHAAATTTNTKLRVRAMKNASVAAATNVIGSQVKQCTTTGWKRKEVTPTISSYTSTDRFWLDVTHHNTGQTRITVVLEFREAVDS